MLLNTLFKHWTYQVVAPGTLLREKYEAFKDLLQRDHEAHEFMAELEEIYYGRRLCDFTRVCKLATAMSDAVGDMVNDLEIMSPMEYVTLKDYYRKINFYIRFMLAPPDYDFSPPFTVSAGQSWEGKDRIADVTGGKGANLFIAAEKLGLPVPRFFIITTNAFYYFLEYNNLGIKIADLLSEIDLTKPESLDKYSGELMKLIGSAEIPADIRRSVQEEVNRLQNESKDIGAWSVRSSAVAEDSENSFAGQYLTRLNVPSEDLLNAYRDVLASKYSPSAICYRIMHGMIDVETPMAVVVQEMLEPDAAGIVYTMDSSSRGCVEIHAVLGLGEAAVGGEVSPDTICVSRDVPRKIIGKKLGRKHVRLVCSDDGDIMRVPVSAEEQERFAIDDQDALQLADWGMEAEAMLKSPQDMEWCKDAGRGLMCLQTRPLVAVINGQAPPEESSGVDVRPILRGTVTASPGAGAGPAHVIVGRAHLSEVPDGAVLVARNIPPSYASIFSRISAIVSEEAVSASHAATVAREAGIPFLSGVRRACSVIESGSPITVDADRQSVYEGVVQELLKEDALCSPLHELRKNSPFVRKMKSIMSFVSPLNLINHESPEFTPENCRTLHDIVRFCHEKAMQEMFMLGDRKRGSARGAQKLAGNLPINFFVLNVGSGVHESVQEKKCISIDEITSIPMRKLWEGLCDPAINWAEGEHFDWGEYDSVVLGGGIINKDSPSLASYAIVSSDYVNLSIRFGYHFVVIDALSTDTSANNYITFRFAGGGGDDQGRFRRAEFLKIVLEKLGFEVDVKGELIDASFKHGTRETINGILPVIGRLLGATRLMDMRLAEEDDIDKLATEFMKGRCDFASTGQA